MKEPCAAEHCFRDAVVRGLCLPHYNHWHEGRRGWRVLDALISPSTSGPYRVPSPLVCVCEHYEPFAGSLTHECARCHRPRVADLTPVAQ